MNHLTNTGNTTDESSKLASSDQQQDQDSGDYLDDLVGRGFLYVESPLLRAAAAYFGFPISK